MVSPNAFAGTHGYFYVVIGGLWLFSTGLAYFYYVEKAGHSLEKTAIAFGDRAFVHNDEEVMAQGDVDSIQIVKA